MLTALNATYGVPDSSKPDFNAATPSALANFLSQKDPLWAFHRTPATSTSSWPRIFWLIATRTRTACSANFDELSKVSGATPAVLSALKDNYSLAPFAIRNVEIVGPKVGGELTQSGHSSYPLCFGRHAGIYCLPVRVGEIYGAAAVLAVFHDVLITLGLFKIFGFEISLTVIAALLTLVGYSMNDTIVIFDRIRENNRLLRKEPFADVVNKSINQTLSRTILTSGLTFLTVLVLFLMGGQVLRAFAFALVVGIVVGTYSSFGIAAPLVVAWNQWRGHGRGSRHRNRSRQQNPGKRGRRNRAWRPPGGGSGHHV